jgi:NDP-sugar pyrophosphorylase family protein
MKAIILAGGLGTRLRPFTEIIPKPMLPIGESSVLEIQIRSLRKHGFTEIYVATNYRSEYVEAFIGDGRKYGVRIDISRESQPLGTCGPVSLLRSELTEPFLLMNGDILTNLDLSRLSEFALEVDADLVVVTKEIVAPFNFGKVISAGRYIVGVEEKPDLKLEILAGIYVLKPPVLDLVPDETYYGIDSLIKDMLARGMPVAKYLTKDFWLDIGQIDDYEEAQEAYRQHFHHLDRNE